MPYIAQKISTGELYYSKGANKLAALIGINPSTITKRATNRFTTKVYKGYIFAKVGEIPNENRGSNIKNHV